MILKLILKSQYVLMFSVSSCANENAWNIKSQKVRHFCHYCMMGVSRGGFMGSNPLPKYWEKLHYKEIMQCDMRALTPSGAWPEAFEKPSDGYKMH